MAQGPDAYSGASWKGKAVEQLVAAKCVLGSGGRLNVSTPFVDDAGVDLVFNLRDHPATLAVQVKSRFRSSKLARNTFMAQVRRATFQARPDLALLFVLYDDLKAHDLEVTWLVPADRFAERTGAQSKGRGRLVFAVSLGGEHNMWSEFRHKPADLATGVEALLQRLNDDRAPR